MVNDLINLFETHKYKVVSIDIYDTLLFRMFRKPNHLFELMYKKSPELFPDHIDADDWREIRSKTETNVRIDIRELGRKEITLPDIYNKLPSIIKNRDNLLKLELECEKGYSYVNEEIAEFIKYVFDRGVKVVLASDMYLSVENIKDILSYNNFDVSIIDRIYVSSDSDATKKTGELFHKILDDYKIEPKDMLHVGDHRISDFSVPRRIGVNAYWYDLIRTASLYYPQLRLEEAVFGSICGEIFVTRLIAAQNASLAEEDRFWYGLGAMQLGPLMTFAVEWVLDTAEKEGIKYIFPLMREGKFLSELLKQAKAERAYNDVRIEPLYISRKALYPALLSVLKEKDIQYNLITHQMKLKSLLELLRAEDLKTEFSPYQDVEIHELKNIWDNSGKTIYSILERKLKDNSYLNDIKARNKDSDILLLRYLAQMGMTDESYITFDIGWRGNVQNAIQRIMNKNLVTTKAVHLLVNGKKFILNERNLEDSCDIRGYTGNFGKNEKEIAGLTNHVLELFLMCDEGTTVGYREQDGQVLPVKKEIVYDENQMRAVRLVQMGALNFQREYFKLKAKKREWLLCRGYEKETLKLILRLLQYPTTKEAKMIGNLSFDQNFGIDSRWKIISKPEFEGYKELGYERFTHEGKARLDEWYRGMDAAINPLGYIKDALFFQRNSENYQMLLFTERIISAYRDGMVLVGAGKACFWLLPYLEMADRLQDVEAILDNKSALLGSYIRGIPVREYSAGLKQKSFVITPTDIEVVQKLKKDIQKHYGSNIQIFDYYTKLSEWRNKDNV